MKTRTKEIDLLNGQKVTCHELTVGEIRNWLKDNTSKEKQIDLVYDGFMSDIAMSDICRMSDLTMEQVDQLTPSDLRVIIDGCKEINSDFFAWQTRLVTLATNVAQMQK